MIPKIGLGDDTSSDSKVGRHEHISCDPQTSCNDDSSGDHQHSSQGRVIPQSQVWHDTMIAVACWRQVWLAMAYSSDICLNLILTWLETAPRHLLHLPCNFNLSLMELWRRKWVDRNATRRGKQNPDFSNFSFKATGWRHNEQTLGGNFSSTLL